MWTSEVSGTWELRRCNDLRLGTYLVVRERAFADGGGNFRVCLVLLEYQADSELDRHQSCGTNSSFQFWLYLRGLEWIVQR